MATQLENLYAVQNSWLKADHPFVTFFETNINHNSAANNVLQLDSFLTQYLRKIIQEPDVITLIISDHGNRFDSGFLEAAFPESQTDVMHPFMFIILPEKPKDYFHQSELTALKANQNRLTTLRDVHFLLKKFQAREPSKPPNEHIYPRGVLTPISHKRECSEIKRFSKGNFFCVCEPNWDEAHRLGEEKVDQVVRFARNELNLRLRKRHGPAKACHELNLSRWDNKPFLVTANKTAEQPQFIAGQPASKGQLLSETQKNMF